MAKTPKPEVKVQVKEPCDYCHGDGFIENEGTCNGCNGKGWFKLWIPISEFKKRLEES